MKRTLTKKGLPPFGILPFHMFIQPKNGQEFCQEATIAEVWNDLPGSHFSYPIAPLGDEVVEKLQFGLTKWRSWDKETRRISGGRSTSKMEITDTQ